MRLHLPLAHLSGFRRRMPASLWLGCFLVLLVVTFAGISFFWTPWPPAAMDMANRFAAPSAAHWLGTDVYGRDLASQLMAGAGNALWVGLLAVTIGLAGGVILGLAAAQYGGWFDEIAMRGADLAFAFPALLLAIIFTAAFGPGVTQAIAAIGLANIPTFARLVRNQARALWQRDFVLAARALGRGRWGITRSHVFPNVLPAIIVQATAQFAVAILAEAALSYLGLGTQPPSSSWGRMLNEAQTLLFDAPLLAVYPGVAIAVAVMGFNQLGDGLRDWLDPRYADKGIR